MRFTIEEYAKAYSISPEMVQSRIRRNRLNYIMEDDKTYIIVPKHQVPFDTEEEKAPSTPTQNTPAPVPEKKRTTVATVIGLYQKENRYLKMKIDELEAKVDRLIAEKEQLLKDERQRIEKVYQDKDTQLKSILELINLKLQQENNHAQLSVSEAEVHEISEEPKVLEETPQAKTSSSPMELKSYLKAIGLKPQQRKAIKRRFAQAFGSDSRILLHDGLFYLDFERFDYSDLLELS